MSSFRPVASGWATPDDPWSSPLRAFFHRKGRFWWQLNETGGARGGTPRQKGSNLYSAYFPASRVTRPPGWATPDDPWSSPLRAFFHRKGRFWWQLNETGGARGGTPRQKGSNLYSAYFPASRVTRPPSRGPRFLVNLFYHMWSISAF